MGLVIRYSWADGCFRVFHFDVFEMHIKADLFPTFSFFDHD
jgi:hypothetical protein